MQLLIVATVSRFTSLWPLWQQRSGDEGRQLTGAPGWCCHQVHLLNLTPRQERRDGERGGGKRGQTKKGSVRSGEEREEWPKKKKVKGGRRRAVSRRGEKNKCVCVCSVCVCMIACSLKPHASPLCKEIHRMPLNL